MQAILLGTGTSTGIPVIGCACEICQSPHAEDRRTRTSLALRNGAETLLFDTAPELRLQVLAAGIKTVRDVIYTHVHADHCHGFDDLRAFYFTSNQPVTCWIPEEFIDEFRTRFSYAFEDTGYLGSKPQVRLKPLPRAPFRIGSFEIDPIRLPHGNVSTAAFRIDSFAYATDFKAFDETQIAAWRGKIRTMVASGIHFGEHKTHSTIPETIALFQELGVERGIITHLSHDVGHHRDRGRLPRGVEFGFDGMVIEV